jgi:hypothetical protein
LSNLCTVASSSFHIGYNGAVASLASGKSISIGTSGFVAGSLVINKLTSSATAPTTLTLGTTATVAFNNCSFAGALEVTAGNIDANTSVFSGNTVWTKLGNTSYLGTGNNQFLQDFTFNNNSTSQCYVPYFNTNTYLGNITVGGTGTGSVLFANNSTSFYKNFTINYNNFQLGSSTATATFAGTTQQVIAGNATTPPSIYRMTVSNAAHLSMQVPVKINHTLQLITGNIITTALAYPTLSSGAGFQSVNGYFVSGPIAKEGSFTSFIMHIGKNNAYKPVKINTPSGTALTDKYLFEYFDNQGTNASSLSAPISAISPYEHWSVQRMSGNASVSLEFTARIPSNFGEGASCIKSVKYGNNAWTNQASDALTFINGNTNVTTTATTGALGLYTIGTNNAVTFNMPPFFCSNSPTVTGPYPAFDLKPFVSPAGGTFENAEYIYSSEPGILFGPPYGIDDPRIIQYTATKDGCTASVTDTTYTIYQEDTRINGLVNNSVLHVCQNELPLTITATPGGVTNPGVLAGNALSSVTNGGTVAIFSATQSGSYPITYTYPLGSTCVHTISVNVFGSPDSEDLNPVLALTTPDYAILNNTNAVLHWERKQALDPNTPIEVKVFPATYDANGNIVPDENTVYTATLLSTNQTVYSTALNALSGFVAPLHEQLFFWKVGFLKNGSIRWTDLSRWMYQPTWELPSPYLTIKSIGFTV